MINHCWLIPLDVSDVRACMYLRAILRLIKVEMVEEILVRLNRLHKH